MIKALFLLYRRPHLSRSEFLAYWEQRHAALARQHGAAMAIRRYDQIHPADSPIANALIAGRGAVAGDFDGVTEVWWDSFEAMAAVGDTATEIAAEILADEGKFVDLKRSILWFGTPKAIIG